MTADGPAIPLAGGGGLFGLIGGGTVGAGVGAGMGASLGASMVRLRLDLGYDGTGFVGWATQPGQRSVQETLEVALATVLRLERRVRATCAGRTDAGVHARGQVVHVDVPSALYDAVRTTLVRRLAGVLPREIRVRRVAAAPDGFDARFAATWRRYAYRVSDTAYGVDPLRRHDVLWHRCPLDLPAMNDAADAVLGAHDFAAFCRRREGATTVRTLRALHWERDAEGIAVATVVADAFCHNMVRSLVGALLDVGSGRQKVEWPARVLATRKRDPAVHVVAAHGLTLEEVGYPSDAVLADRARVARARKVAESSAAAPG